ncbi:hypothetical protein P7C71_g1322, partial [Lecanoromycetidae sp. Uapishka_2]
MAPARLPMFQKDEKVLCFHHELLYEAKVTEYKHFIENDKNSPFQYRVHYKGWKNTWDDWVPQDRLRKLNDENRELASNLKREIFQLNNPGKVQPNKTKKAASSDFSSNRGSEDRHLTPAATGRGQKRGRDTEIEKRKARKNFDEGYGTDLEPAQQHQQATIVTKKRAREPAGDEKPLKRAKNAPQVAARRRNAPALHSPTPIEEAEAWLEAQGRDRSLAPPTANYMSYLKTGKAPKAADFQHMCQFTLDFKIVEFKPAPRPRLITAGIPLDDTPEDLEDIYIHKPAVHIRVPDHLKALLVDDWENVTKNRALIPLPSQHPVNEILSTYFEEEKGKRRLGSADADLLEETNMDGQSVSKLKEEIAKLTSWLGKNSDRFFTAKYEDAGPEYTEKTRGS